MLNCVIIDDERQSIESLKWKLENIDIPIHVSATFSNLSQALEELPEMDIDILFLDIEMPVMNGFEFLSKLSSKNFATIFVTAHDDYILKALRISAFDYLLKPADIDDLEETVGRFVKNRKGTEYEKLYQLLERNLTNKSDRKIALATSDSIKFVEESKIIYCNSDSNYTTFHLVEGEQQVVSITLKKAEDLLSSHFLRVHNSYVVNRHYIEAYHRGSGGSLLMKGDHIIPVSKSRRDQLLDLLKG